MYNNYKKNLAKKLRLKGLSIENIASKIFVAKSTVSLWVRDLKLSDCIKMKMEDNILKGRLLAIEKIKSETLKRENNAVIKAKEVVINIKQNYFYEKIICALVYYCEGNKYSKGGVMFTNSDPALVRSFLRLFRSSFSLDESKFRVCVHLHKYHNKDEQLKFWSKNTKIPLGQFIKPYLKNNSGLYKKKDYQGCVSIRYYDVNVARELNSLALVYMQGPIG